MVYLFIYFYTGMLKKTAGKIPRYEGLMKKKAALRPTTPSNTAFHYLHSLCILTRYKHAVYF